MELSTGRALALNGLGLTVIAGAMPWTSYGSYHTAFSLPSWGVWVVPAAALHAAALMRLAGDTRWRRIAVAALGAATVAGAIVVAAGYDDAAAIHGRIVPLIRPTPGPGVLFALLGVLLTTATALGAIVPAGTSGAPPRGDTAPGPVRAGADPHDGS